jgi:hypothetical protein
VSRWPPDRPIQYPALAAVIRGVGGPLSSPGMAY